MNHSRSIPWSPEEHVYVDGLPLVYTLRRLDKRLMVRLPGGEKTTTEALRARGCQVRLPKRVRID